MRVFGFSVESTDSKSEISKEVHTLLRALTIIHSLFCVFITGLYFAIPKLGSSLGYSFFVFLLFSLLGTGLLIEVSENNKLKEAIAYYIILLSLYILSLVNIIPLLEGDTEFTSVKSKGYRDYGLSRISNTFEIHKDIFESFFNIITAVVFGLAGFIFILYLCVKSTSTIRNESLVASLSAQRLVLTGKNMYGIMIADFAIPGSVIEFSLDYEDVVSVDVKKYVAERQKNSTVAVGHNLFINCNDNSTIKLLVNDPFEVATLILNEKINPTKTDENAAQVFNNDTTEYEDIKINSDDLPDFIYCPHCGRMQKSTRDTCFICNKKLY